PGRARVGSALVARSHERKRPSAPVNARMAMSRISTTAVTAKAPGTSSMTWRRLRFIPLFAGALAMAVGLWSGLARLGLSLPGGTPALAESHAPFVMYGFLGP